METKVTINGKDPYDCTKDEIFEAWDQLKSAYNIIKRRAALRLHPGMRVYFVSRKRGRVYGTITKVNSTTVNLIQEDNHMSWKVGSSMICIAQ
jgi:hypothetical protein